MASDYNGSDVILEGGYVPPDLAQFDFQDVYTLAPDGDPLTAEVFDDPHESVMKVDFF